MAVKIKSIDIHAFRGIPELYLPIEGKNLLIRGENGTGKSSIVEAFEFFFTGSISHLEGTRGISISRHGPHIKYDASDVKVSIAFDPGNICLTRTFETHPKPPILLSKYLNSARSGTFILKRSQILEFIASQPADRFRALASIIGVEPLDEIELEMMRVRDDLEGEVRIKSESVQRLLGALSSDLQSEIQAVDEVLPALNRILETANLPLIGSFNDVEAHAQKMLKVVKGASSVELISTLNLGLQQIREAIISDQFIPRMKSLSKKVEPLLQEKARVKLKLSELLDNSQQIIKEEELDTCPVCGQNIDRESVLAIINRRMEILQALSERASNIRKESVPLIAELNEAKRRISGLVDLLSKVDGLEIESLSELTLSKILNEGPVLIKKASDLQEPILLGEIQEQITLLEGLWVAVGKEIKGALDKIGLTEEEKKLLDVVRLIGNAKEKATLVSEANSELQRLKLNLQRAEEIYNSFSGSKKQKVAQIYEEIQADIQHYYSILHPDESHTDIELKLSTGQRASTELRMRSFGREAEDPRGLTSEGHLDSLGLCIFMAFVRSFNQECSLIILDDVVTTIDSRHRSRICDLLYGEFNNYQLVITTHDGIWYQELQTAQRTYRLDSKFLNLEINGWEIDTGPKIDNYLPRIDNIKNKLRVNDKTGAANDSRQYLEWILKQIILGTNAPIPIGNWLGGTVKDLEPHAKKRLLSLVDDNDYIKMVKEAFDQLERTVPFGNLLSHDNILAEQVSIVEVETFFKSVVAVHLVVSCQECGAVLKYFRDTKEYRCPNTRCSNPSLMRTN